MNVDDFIANSKYKDHFSKEFKDFLQCFLDDFVHPFLANKDRPIFLASPDNGLSMAVSIRNYFIYPEKTLVGLNRANNISAIVGRECGHLKLKGVLRYDAMVGVWSIINSIFDQAILVCNAVSKLYSDGEFNLSVYEPDIVGKEVILVHSITKSVTKSVNDSFVELLLIIDAVCRAGAEKVILVIPYLGYARQDKPVIASSADDIDKRILVAPLSAKVICSTISSVVDRVFAFDCHSQQICGFFDVPFRNIELSDFEVLRALCIWIVKDFDNTGFADFLGNWSGKYRDALSSLNLCIVAPDSGAFSRAHNVSSFLKQVDDFLKRDINKDGSIPALENIPVVVVNKIRSAPGVSQTFESAGDVAGKDCIIVDDIIDSAGTICNAARYLKGKGAKTVRAIISHGVLSGPGIDNVRECEALDALCISDSINCCGRPMPEKIKTFSVGPSIASYLYRYLFPQN